MRQTPKFEPCRTNLFFLTQHARAYNSLSASAFKYLLLRVFELLRGKNRRRASIHAEEEGDRPGPARIVVERRLTVLRPP